MATTTAAIVIILRKRHQPLLVGHGTDLLRPADRTVIANKISTGAVRDATLFPRTRRVGRDGGLMNRDKSQREQKPNGLHPVPSLFYY